MQKKTFTELGDSRNSLHTLLWKILEFADKFLPSKPPRYKGSKVANAQNRNFFNCYTPLFFKWVVNSDGVSVRPTFCIRNSS